MKSLVIVLVILATRHLLASPPPVLHCDERLRWVYRISDFNSRGVAVFAASSRLALGSTGALRPGDLDIIEVATGEVVGSAGIMLSGKEQGLVRISVDEKKRQGIATEAEFLLLKGAFEVHGYTSVIASIRTNNEASIRLHEKLGFVRTGSSGDSSDKIKYLLTKERFLELEKQIQGSDSPRDFFRPSRGAF